MGKHKDKTKKYKKHKNKSKKQKKYYSSSSEESTRRKGMKNSSEEDNKQDSSSSGRDGVKNKRNKTYSKYETKFKKARNNSSSSSEEWFEKNVNNSSSSEDESTDKKYSRKRKSESDSNHDRKNKEINNYTKNKKKHKKEYSSSSEEWVEKRTDTSSSDESIDKNRTHKRKRSSQCNSQQSSNYDSVKYKIQDLSGNKTVFEERCKDKREDWMTLQTSFLTSSNSIRRLERNEARKLEREKQQYNPRQCSRELNPYWKDGGDGLPKFKRPNLDNELESHYSETEKCKNKSFHWRKKNNENKTTISDCNEEPNTNLKNANDEEISEKELNILAAKLLKAEIIGNTKLVNELKEKLDKARNSRKHIKSVDKEEQILLTLTDSYGKSQPLKLQSEYGGPLGSHKRKKNVETHVDGQRVRYFADDEKYSLKQMFEKEKYNSVENQNSEFLKMFSKVRKNDDLDDIFSDNIRKKESDSKIDSKNRERAISEYQKITKSLDDCNKCIQSEIMLKHLMISMRETCYLALPSFEPLTEGHCLIIPIRHVPCATQLDENEWTEVLDMRKSLVRLFKSKNQEVIFFETAVSFHKFPHMCIECIPMPREEGDMAPIYFKKAIDESETEWALNKKLVSLKGKDVRKAVPKGLSYFSVSFGTEEGFAHVIEDERMFPNNFAQEIIGGMLDVHHSKWRKPKRQSFEEQSKRVVEFSREWKDFDDT